jgi:hypothetical protein
MTANLTSFRKGRRKTGGRQHGTPNKNTRVLREAVLLAAAAAGNEGGNDGLFQYLKKVAKKRPAIFFPLLARLLPLQIESQETANMQVTYRSAAEVRDELLRRGVPVNLMPVEPPQSDVELGPRKVGSSNETESQTGQSARSRELK